MIKRILAALFCLLFCLSPVSAETVDANLLTNPGFEQLNSDGMPVGWFTDAYIKREGVSLYTVSDDAKSGDVAISVENFDMNDARFAQTVQVEPNAMYRLSGWIRASGIGEIGHGANLSIEGVHARSDSFRDTSGTWEYVETYGVTGDDQTEVTIFARVGGYSGESIGAAWFDDLSLVRVDELPIGVFAEAWYTMSEPQVVSPVDQKEGQEAGPAWPWLIVVAAAYAVCAFLVMRHIQLDRIMAAKLEHEQKSFRSSNAMPAFVIIGLCVAALARILTALNVEGYQVDVNCFTAWGSTMSNVGPGLFYQSNWCDYTPGYIYVMGLNGWIAKLLNGLVSAAFVHKLLPMACDLAAAWLIYRLAVEHEYTRRQGGFLALLFAFNPATFLNSAAWCQIDSVLSIGLILVAYFAIHRKWAIVLPMYVLCILVKPQALMLGFLGLAALIVEWVQHPPVVNGKKIQPRCRRDMGIGLIISILLALVIVLPFSPNQETPKWLIEQYIKTLGSYNHATVNTANIFYLAGANWVEITNPASTGVIAFFFALSLVWAVYTWIRQCKHVHHWWIETLIMAAYAVTYLVLLFTGCSWTVLGWATMSMAFAVVLPMFIRSGKMEHLPLCGAVIFLLLYVFGIKMHERYLFPAIFLFGMAYAVHRDRRILWLLVGSSCVLFINEGIILDNSLRLGSSMGHLNQDTTVLANLLSIANIAFALLSIWTCHRICVEDTRISLSERLPEPVVYVPVHESAPCTPLNFKSDAKLVIERLDVLLICIVTAIYSIVTLTTLGSAKAPQTAWKSSSSEERVYIDLGRHYDDFSMLYFAQVSYKDFAVSASDRLLVASEAGETSEGLSEEYPAQMREGMCFSWQYLDPSYTANGEVTFVDATDFSAVQKLSGRYVCINPKQYGLTLNEIIFKDAEGNIIPNVSIAGRENANERSSYYSDPANLLDEQDTLEGEPGWWNSTYFDEIYHARTAFEHLNQTNAYEWTHPPLGKIIMSWFIALFGMTPFGWRFAGALCGILMLPAMYLLTKQLTKRTDIAFYGMMLMALDCMHFTQTRLATIDSYPVLFIILSYFFMLRFMQRDIVLENTKKLLPDLAFSGFFMGCGFASKWIGAYAGIGLALLFFWTCLRHIRLSREAAAMLNSDSKFTEGESDVLSARKNRSIRRIIVLCAWCVLFFVLIPLIIYLLSYVVHFADREFDSIGQFLQTVYNTNFGEYNSMLSYHGTPGLGMDHYYYSPWYEWPLMTKPMYYASATFKPAGKTFAIFCFGNPWVWVIGIAGVVFTAGWWATGHRYIVSGKEGNWHFFRDSWDINPSFILIGLLAQFLPWVLVPRGTYIYHYFASIPFLMLGIALMVYWISLQSPKLGKVLIIGHLILCAVWFILLFPYASGVMTPDKWMDFIRDYPYISLLPDYWKHDWLVNLNDFLEKIPVFPHVYHH